MNTSLRLTLLGGLTLRLNDRPLTELTSQKARALLCYLAVTGRDHARSTLASLLWPEVPEASARVNLRNELVELRRVVGPYLQVSRQTIAFNARADYWLDVERFERLIQAPTNIAALTEAVSLYQGEFLAGLAVLNADPFDDWLRLERIRLHEACVSARQRLASAYERLGDLEGAISHIRHLLAIEPWREEAHQQLMRLYAQNGQRSLALAQYDICCQTLAQELAAEPSPETSALYEQLRTGAGNGQALMVEGQGDFAASRSRHNLPAEQTPFIGRAVELRALAELITESATRLITIVGAGGMGKTRLALAAAEGQLRQNHFRGGIYFVPLAHLSDPDYLVPAIAEALNFTFYEGDTPRRQLLNYLSRKQMLLILDNFEQLIKAAEPEQAGGVELITEILHHAPAIKLLITSRQRLHLHQEQLYPIRGLAVPDKAETQPALTADAVRLFLQSAKRIRPDFEVEAKDLSHLIDICRLVEGMPLGLELAAAWIDLLSLAEIKRGLDFLTTENYDMPERHQSMRAVFDTAWQQLTATEQHTFAQLSIFRGGFTRAAAQAVVSGSIRTLASLVSKSLLHYNPRRNRYEIHELLRQFAAGRLTDLVAADQPALLSAVHNRHSAYYCAFLHQREAELKGFGQQEALAEIEADGENIRAAWHWAIEEGHFEYLGQALDSLGLFLLWRGRLYEGEGWYRQALESLSQSRFNEEGDGPTKSWSADCDRLRVRLLIGHSRFLRHLRQLENAQQALQQAQRQLDSPPLLNLDTRLEQANLWLELAEVVWTSDSATASQLAERSLAVYQILNDSYHKAQSLDLLGGTARQAGQVDLARQTLVESLRLWQALGDARGEAWSLLKLSAVARQQGQFQEAEVITKQSLAICRQIGSRDQLAQTLSELGIILILSGKPADSLPLLKESLAIYEDLGLPKGGLSYLQLGGALVELGRYNEASAYLQTALTRYSETGDQRGVGLTLKHFGRIALVERKYDDAQGFLQESVTILRQAKDLNGLGESLGFLGFAALRLKSSQAQQYLFENLQIAVATKLFLPHLIALAGASLLLAHEGQTERAVELYALASQHGHVANSRWYEEVVGRQIAEVSKTLPSEVVVAAKVRGRSRDLWQTAQELLAEFEQAQRED